MAQTRKLGGEATLGEAGLPLLAAVALQNGGASNEDLQLLLKELLSDAVQAKRKEREKHERLAMQAVKSAEEYEQVKHARRSNCSHRKLDGSSRLAGQKLSSGQYVFVCQFCQSEFHHPAGEGQHSVPQGLFPHRDEIGG